MHSLEVSFANMLLTNHSMTVCLQEFSSLGKLFKDQDVPSQMNENIKVKTIPNTFDLNHIIDSLL